MQLPEEDFIMHRLLAGISCWGWDVILDQIKHTRSLKFKYCILMNLKEKELQILTEIFKKVKKVKRGEDF